MKKWILAIVLCWLPWLFAAENAEGITYCHNQTLIKFTVDRSNKNNDVLLTIDGRTQTLMTAYSWFGSIQQPPKGFRFAILGEGRFDPLLVFEDHLIDAANNRYLKCTE